MLREKIEPATEQVQRGRLVVFADTTGVEEDVDAGTELRGTPVGGDDIIERGARIFPIWISAVRIGAVVQEPLDRLRLDCLARSENDWEIAVPFGVDVGAVGSEKLHHRNAMTEKRSSHQRALAALMHVRTVFDHPLRHRPPFLSRLLPRHAAFGYPSERTVFVIAKGSAMQGGVASHERFYALEVIGVDGLLELSDLLE